jgi:TetR/AcrR family transcriptional regulator, transcriptional repressor for nem operon
MPPRAHAASDTRERIVDAARHLFWEKGYGASGLAEILDRAGANSGSFYHFFESKDALLRTVLDTYVDLLEPHIVRPAWDATSDPIQRIFALLDGYRRRLVDTDCRYGCPIGRLALEIDPENTPAHDRIARNFSAWKRAVESCLRAASVRQADETAIFVLTVMEGALMQSRVYRNIEPFDACIRQLRLHLGAAAGRKRSGRTRQRT